MSRRSMGQSVSVSSSRNLPPPISLSDHKNEVLDADAVLPALVVAGLVGEDHARLERQRVACRKPVGPSCTLRKWPTP